MTEKRKYSAWIVSDGRVGRRNQCLGVAQKIPADIEVLKIKDIEEAGSLTHYLEKKFGRTPQAEDWPDVLLSSGDDAGNIAVNIKRLSNGKIFLAGITPHVNSIRFDLMTNIKHGESRPALSNMEMIGVPHKVTPKEISKETNKWRDRMQGITESGKPILSVLIGGNVNDSFEFDMKEAKELGEQINKEAKRLDAALLMTNSPRISVPVWRELLKNATDGIEYAYIHDCRKVDAGAGNPFSAMLGMADVIMVTGDSISMVSEATSTGKPVYIASPDSITPKLYKQMHQDFYDRGLARKFDKHLEAYKVEAKPLDEAGRIANKISEELDKRMSKHSKSPAR